MSQGYCGKGGQSVLSATGPHVLLNDAVVAVVETIEKIIREGPETFGLR